MSPGDAAEGSLPKSTQWSTGAYSEWVPGYGIPIAQIASGPNGNDLNWTRKFFERARGSLARTWGFALHHYSWNLSSGRTTEWMAVKRDALKFDDEQYYELLSQPCASSS